jgi:hypothetical protein
MGLKDDIRREITGGDMHIDADSLVITQALNKLFYVEHNIEAESNFVKLVLSKNGLNKERKGLHASAIIVSDNEFCYREQVLSLFYKQAQGENVPINLKRIFEEGNAIHEKWQRLLIRGGLGKANDMDRSRFSEEYDLSYTPDIECKIGKKRYIGEIKSVNTFQYKNMQSHPSGKKQLMLYMHLTGVHNGFVLAEDKNTQDFKIFSYEYDPSILAPYIERLEAIQEYKYRFVKFKKMVGRICDKSTCKRATKCNMRDACFNIGMGRVKL